MDDLSVGLSVCPVHCGKTANRIRMPFRIIGRTGPGMRQVAGFGDRSTGRGTFGAHLGRAIVTSGVFTASVCDSASTVGAPVWGGARGGPRHCCIRWRSTSCREKGRLGVVSHFHNGKCLWVADGEMFPIRMRKLHNISVRQTYMYCLKARFVRFLAIIQFQDQCWGLWEISKNVTIFLRKVRPTQQRCRRNMHIHEWTPRCTGPPRTATHAGCSTPQHHGN